MRQRIFFRTLLGAQFLVFLVLFGAGIYCLWLSRTHEILSDADAADTIHGLRTAAAWCIGLCFIWGASFLGILRRQRWGWWLGFVANVFVLGVTGWGVLEDRSWYDIEDLLLPVIFLILTGLHLLSRPTTWSVTDAPVHLVDENKQPARSGI